MNLKPLSDKLVLEQLEMEEKTSSGIILPDSAKEKPLKAKVLAVGKDVKEIKEGDIVLYSQYGPNEVKLDGRELLIGKEEDILAIIKANSTNSRKGDK